LSDSEIPDFEREPPNIPAFLRNTG